MTWEIALVFLLLIAVLVSFVWEKIPPDLTALALFVVLMATGLLKPAEAFGVFSNTAPLTVGAMFVLSAALVKCGAVDRLSSLVEASARLPYAVVMLALVVMVAGISAFINNTPVVVVFLPVVLNLARKMHLAPSKLLIPSPTPRCSAAAARCSAPAPTSSSTASSPPRGCRVSRCLSSAGSACR
jgi:di/tricarboxylate transporter